MSGLAWALLILLSIVWGGSFFFVEIALAELDPLTIVAGRVALAALILLAYLKVIGEHLPRDPGTLLQLLIMGALNNALPFSLIVWGQIHLTSGVAAILNAATPLFTVLLAHLLTYDERMTANKLLGVIIGMVGVAALMGPSAVSGLGDHLLAQLAIVCATISYAVASLYGRRLRRLSSPVAATGMLCGSSVLLLPLAFMFESPLHAVPSAPVLLAVLGLAALSTALAYLLYFRILLLAGSTNLMLVTLLVPVSAALLGVLVLGEQLPTSALIGMGVIFVGLLCIDGRLLRRSTAQSQ